MDRQFLRSALLLGLLCSVGPLSIDMYLPALPAIADDLDAPVASVQMTLTVYFIAFGVAQIVYGPLADTYGRRAPLLAGLALFMCGSVGSALAGDVVALMAFRFLQGLGGASVMVIPRAIVRDMHTGTQATRLMATIMLVISVSPMLAPLGGSGLIALGGWRLIFAALTVAAVLSAVLVLTALPETLAPVNRVPLRPATLARNSAMLLRDRTFMGLTFIGGFGLASFFVFLSSSAFVYTQHFGMSPTQFSLAFSVNALGFFTATQFAASLGERFGMGRVILRAVTGFAGFSALLLVATLLGFGQLPVLMSLLFCLFACLGLVIPPAMVMALDEHGEHAGLASSLGGTMQMVTGGAMIAIASPFFDSTPKPMVVFIAICAACAFMLALRVLTTRRAAEQPAE